jgi:branched-chain amino acid transport system substrate-binding protein
MSLGLDLVHDTQVLVDMDNAKGGIDIGGQKYKIDLIIYDSNNVQANEVAAFNRLIFEDKAKFIISNGNFMESWLQITEDNKVVTLAGMASIANLDPKWHYACNPNGNTMFPVTAAWFAQKYPDLVKNFVLALPDNQGGHFMQFLIGMPAEVMGAKINYQFYPPGQTDLSSLGTKVNDLKPGVFSTSGGGDIEDGLAMTAAWRAGYRGQYFFTTPAPYGSLAKVMPVEALEGMIAGAEATEFDPALTQEGEAFKTAYKAKFGKWDDPSMLTPYYSCLKAALEAAGTTDTDKVAGVIQSGLKFPSTRGEYQMIPRPDLKNDRTVDAINTIYLKTIKNGKPVLVDTLSLAQANDIWQTLGKAMASAGPPK